MKLLYEWLYEELNRAEKQLDDLEVQLEAGNLLNDDEYAKEYAKAIQKEYSLLTLLQVTVNLLKGYPAETAIRIEACEILELTLKKRDK